MTPNPALGVLFHWLGGLASGSFYVPYRGVKRWSWETYWLVGGVFSWLVAPWLLASLLTVSLWSVLTATPGRTVFWCFFFGLLWGIGGLTFGLTMRYLGLSLGMAIVMGLCAAFGTLMPPIFNGTFVKQVLETTSGEVILGGIAMCLAGIAIAGVAGVYKDRSTTVKEQQSAVAEFNLKKGFLVALLSGIMSACFAYGLAAGEPIKRLTMQAGTSPLWQGLPVLVVVLLGGFVTNFAWTAYLNIRNGSSREYFAATVVENSARIAESAFSPAAVSVEYASAVSTRTRVAETAEAAKVPLARNYLLCALAGVTWYMQFFFYTMGETKMGKYQFSSWTLHMASIVIFSTLWGLGLHEWRGASKKALQLLFVGLAVLVGSTIVIGYGNYLAAR